jgi:hypothetical protein
MKQEIYIECDDMKRKRLKRSHSSRLLLKKSLRRKFDGTSAALSCAYLSPLNRVLLNFGNLSISAVVVVVVGARGRKIGGWKR